MALSDELIRRLSEMRHRADAERRVSYMPLGSIYWTDEFSEAIDDLFEDGNEARLAPLLRLFAIRGALWTGAELSEGDRAFWDEARAQAPDYALFHHLQVSEEEVAMYRDVALAARGFWKTFFRADGKADAATTKPAAPAPMAEAGLLANEHDEVELLAEVDIVQTLPRGQ